MLESTFVYDVAMLFLCKFWICILIMQFWYLHNNTGLSLCVPNICVKEAKEQFLKEIATMNSTRLNPKGLNLSYKSECSTSWVFLQLY